MSTARRSRRPHRSPSRGPWCRTSSPRSRSTWSRMNRRDRRSPGARTAAAQQEELQLPAWSHNSSQSHPGLRATTVSLGRPGCGASTTCRCSRLLSLATQRTRDRRWPRPGVLPGCRLARSSPRQWRAVLPLFRRSRRNKRLGPSGIPGFVAVVDASRGPESPAEGR